MPDLAFTPTPEEAARAASLAAALARYHSDPTLGLPVLDPAANRWHDAIYVPPALINGFAPWPEGYVPETTSGPKGMSMAEFINIHGPVKAPPSPGSAAKAAQLHEEDKPAITAREKKAAEKRRLEAERAARKAAEEADKQRRQEAQGSLLGLIGG